MKSKQTSDNKRNLLKNTLYSVNENDRLVFILLLWFQHLTAVFNNILQQKLLTLYKYSGVRLWIVIISKLSPPIIRLL